MIAFLRNFCASLAALAVFFVALPLALLFAVAVFVAALGQGERPPGGVLVLDLSDGVAETSPAKSSVKIRGGFFKRPPESVLDICSKIRAAAADPSVEAVLVRGSFADSCSGGSLAQASEIRAGLAGFSKSGKPVYAYLENPTFADYYLASAADSVFMNPFGTMEFKGLSASTPFFGAALRKYGIGVALVKSGEFKSAGEIFTGEKMAAPQKAHLAGVLESVWGGCARQIADSRKLSSERLEKIAREDAVFPASAAEKFGFADGLLYRDGLEDLLSKKHGRAGGTFRHTPMRAYSPRTKGGADKIAVVSIEGEIGETSSRGRAGAEKISRILRELGEDRSVKAVVLRIDSPGGRAFSSESIRREAEALSKKAKVVSSFGATAASGAYWIATASEKIFADPATVTGSIGVFSVAFSVEKIAADYGVFFDGVKTAPFADFMSATRGADPAELAKLKSLCDMVYERFVELVSKSRGMSPEEARRIADGKIYDGARAVELGLCDALGGVEDAVAEAARLAGCESYSVIRRPLRDPIGEFFSEGADYAPSSKFSAEFKAIFGKASNFAEDLVETFGQQSAPKIYLLDLANAFGE